MAEVYFKHGQTLLDLKMTNIDSYDEKRIYFGCPFYGSPTADETGDIILPYEKIMIIDSNITSFIRKRANIQSTKALLEWSYANNVKATPIIAVAEQFVSHGDPEYAFNELLDELTNYYKVPVVQSKVSELISLYKERTPFLKKNAETFADFLVIAKSIYREKGDSKQKIKRFTEIIIERDLPRLSFCFFAVCTFLHAKENRNKLAENLIKKIDQDMSFKGERSKEEQKLINLASDMLLFHSATEILFDKSSGRLNIAIIASTDITVGYLLKEICYGQVTQKNNGCWGHCGLRPGGYAYRDLFSFIKEVYPKREVTNFEINPESIQRNNLRKVAEEILNKQFTS